jgi:hypothetical protein
MIYFKSLLADLAGLPSISPRTAAGKPSPKGEGWGSNERSECRLVCCSDVGELHHRGRQSALIEADGALAKALRPCPLGTFENSQQPARVTYGWVHGRQHSQSPEGTVETFSRVASLNNRSSGRKPALIKVGHVSPLTAAKNSHLPAFPSKSLRFPASAVQSLTGQKQTGWAGKLNKKFMQPFFTLDLPSMSQKPSRFTSALAVKPH